MHMTESEHTPYFGTSVKLKEARNAVAETAPIPPRDPGWLIGHTLDKLPFRRDDVAVDPEYEPNKKNYLARTARDLTDSLRSPEGLKRLHEKYPDENRDAGDPFRDNDLIVGAVMGELNGAFLTSYDGKDGGKKRVWVWDALPRRDTIATVSGGTFGKAYEEGRSERVGKKMGGVATVVASGAGTGFAYHELFPNPGLLSAAATATGMAVGYVATAVRTPSPARHKALVSPAGLESKRFDKVKNSVMTELGMLGFDEETPDSAEIRENALKMAKKLKRKPGKKSQRQRAQKIARLLDNRGDTADLDELRVTVATLAVADELEIATTAGMAKERRLSGLKHAIGGIAAGLVIAGTSHVVDTAYRQHQEWVNDVDPLEHGDTSYQDTDSPNSDILPGGSKPVVQITIPTK